MCPHLCLRTHWRIYSWKLVRNCAPPFPNRCCVPLNSWHFEPQNSGRMRSPQLRKALCLVPSLGRTFAPKLWDDVPPSLFMDSLDEVCPLIIGCLVPHPFPNGKCVPLNSEFWGICAPLSNGRFAPLICGGCVPPQWMTCALKFWEVLCTPTPLKRHNFMFL